MVKKSDWKTVEMPSETEEFMMKISFSEDEMKKIQDGLCPCEMEDKWFMYFENGRLYIHRSWTGFCIYIADFSEADIIRVTVNRNQEQYTETNIERDKICFNIAINSLIGRNSRELMLEYVKMR